MTFKKKAIPALIASALLSIATLEASELKVGVIDLNRLFAESKAAQGLQKAVEEHGAKFQAEIEKQETTLHEAESKLAAEQSKLKPEEFAKKRAEFENKVANVQEKVAEKRMQLEQALEKAKAKVEQNIGSIVTALAEKKGLTLVIPRGATLFRAESLEMTDEVLKQLDEKLPSVSFTLETAKSEKKG
ncbi:MAG: OmpH family outer membrane protein [Holosporales bacterium]